MRVPMIAKLPGVIPAGSICSELTTTMDFLPTFCQMSGAAQPKAKIDGHDISSLLKGQKDAKSPYDAFYYYRRRQLQAIRMGDWKWHLPLEQTHPNWTSAKPLGKGRSGMLINLKTDLQELNDVSEQNPKIMAKMKKLAQHATATFGNDAKNGSEQRQAKTLDSSKPMVLRK